MKNLYPALSPSLVLPTPVGNYSCCGRTITAETYSEIARQHRALHGATR